MGETSRVRSFLLYGKDEADQNDEDECSNCSLQEGSRLIRMVVSHEEKDRVSAKGNSSSLLDRMYLNPPTQIDQLTKGLFISSLPVFLAFQIHFEIMEGASPPMLNIFSVFQRAGGRGDK